MHRRDFLIKTSLFSASSLFYGLPQSFAESPFTPLRKGVGFFTARGGTIGYRIAEDGVVVIDTQFPDSAQTCLKGLKERSQRGIDLVFNTHHHGDHTAGNGVFKPHAKKIIAHAQVPALQRANAERRDNLEAQTYADTTFEEELVEDLGGEKVSARYFGAAHTGGDSVIYLERANVAHIGDLVFNRLHPFIDRPGGASIAGWIEVLDKIAKTYPADTLYIFGHGRDEFGVAGSADDLQVMAGYLGALLDIVRKDIAAGKTQGQNRRARDHPRLPRSSGPVGGGTRGQFGGGVRRID